MTGSNASGTTTDNTAYVQHDIGICGIMPPMPEDNVCIDQPAGECHSTCAELSITKPTLTERPVE